MMTVGEMISMLEDYPEDMPVVVKEHGMGYVCNVSDANFGGIHTFWGDNVNECVTITLGSQVGMGTDVQVDDEDMDW